MDHNHVTLKGIDRPKLDFLCPQFELYLSTLLADRERMRTRAWQGLGLSGVMIGFFTNLFFEHLGEWPLWAHTYLAAHVAVLAVISARLVKGVCMPKPYIGPGAMPDHWFRDHVLEQSVEGIMAAQAFKIRDAINMALDHLSAESKALSRFARHFVRSPIIPALLAALVALLEWRSKFL